MGTVRKCDALKITCQFHSQSSFVGLEKQLLLECFIRQGSSMRTCDHPSETEEAPNRSWWWQNCIMLHEELLYNWISAQRFQILLAITQKLHCFKVTLVCNTCYRLWWFSVSRVRECKVVINSSSVSQHHSLTWQMHLAGQLTCPLWQQWADSSGDFAGQQLLL